MALDVMVSSMVALSATEDDDAADVLIGACIDAARLYQGSTAIVKAAVTEPWLCGGGPETCLRCRRRGRPQDQGDGGSGTVGDMNERVDGGIEQREPPKRQLDVGAAVEVRNRFVGKWCHGFEVADHVDGGYVIRRVSDRAVLPAVITHDEVRSDRRT